MVTIMQGHNVIKLGKSKGKKHIFLGGTCGTSKWRDEFIKKIDKDKYTYFNPIVEEWDEEARKEEERQKDICDYNVFVITPKMEGLFSIAETVEISNKRPETLIFCYIEKDDDKTFSEKQLDSLDKVKEIIENNGGRYLVTLDEVINFLNKE